MTSEGSINRNQEAMEKVDNLGGRLARLSHAPLDKIQSLTFGFALTEFCAAHPFFFVISN